MAGGGVVALSLDSYYAAALMTGEVTDLQEWVTAHGVQIPQNGSVANLTHDLLKHAGQIIEARYPSD